MSMYIDHKSHRLGCESIMPSNSVLPRSGSPYLYSSCAKRDIVFKSVFILFQPKALKSAPQM